MTAAAYNGGYVADVEPGTPLRLEAVADDTSASYTYTSAAVPFVATCDALNLATAVSWDDGARARAVAEGRQLPTILFPWTYSGLMVDDATLNRAASKGFAVLRANVRGHGGPGLPDDGCREVQDYVDAVREAAVALAWIAPDRHHVMAYSGGAGVALAALAKALVPMPTEVRSIASGCASTRQAGFFSSNPRAGRAPCSYVGAAS